MWSWFNSIFANSVILTNITTNLNKLWTLTEETLNLNRTNSEPQQDKLWTSTEQTLNLNRTHPESQQNKFWTSTDLPKQHLNCIDLYLNCWNLQSVVHDARKVINSYLKNKQIWTESGTERESSHEGLKKGDSMWLFEIDSVYHGEGCLLCGGGGALWVVHMARLSVGAVPVIYWYMLCAVWRGVTSQRDEMWWEPRRGA